MHILTCRGLGVGCPYRLAQGIATMTEPIKIDPAAYYTASAARLKLGITESALAKARQRGVVRYSRQGGRTLYRGDWLDSWLAGEGRQQETGK